MDSLVRRSKDLDQITFQQLCFHVMSERFPFAKVRYAVVYPQRQSNNRESYRERWWLYAEARPGMRKAIAPLKRYIVTPALSKHRVFLWQLPGPLCNQQIMIIAREDDYFLGVLHSRLHEVWALKMGTALEDRPRYTPTSTFETFPFP